MRPGSRLAAPWAKVRPRLQIVFDDIRRGDDRCRKVAGAKETIRIPFIADADVSIGVEHAFVRQEAGKDYAWINKGSGGFYSA